MHNHDEGSMPYNLGEAAFNAALERIASVPGRIPEQIQYTLILLAIVVAGWMIILFSRRLFRTLHERELEQDRIDQEALLDLAHRGELPSGR